MFFLTNKKKEMKLAANKPVTAVLRGKTSFAKIVGDPRLNYTKDGKEWSMDLELTKAGVKDCKDLGITSKVKMKPGYLDGAPHIRFKRTELNKDGEPNKPIPIVDITGKPWDGRLLGNGSVVDVKFRVVDYGVGKPQGIYIQKVRVLELVPYEQAEDMPDLSEDDEYFAKYAAAEQETLTRKETEDRQFKKDFGLDDEVDDIGDDEDEPVD